MNTNDNFISRLESFIAQQGLLIDNQCVLVAVSGGADSMALLAALRRCGKYNLHIGHVHHSLRAEADDDAQFVRDLALRWNIPFHLEKIDTRKIAREEGIGIEQAARKGRYEALIAMAKQVGASVVAVAHHADDQVETVLHHIFRGTHLRGLAGMPAKRTLCEGIDLIRPLLWTRREEIEAFCRDEKLNWRIDHTNIDTEFTRNFIRHELLPILRERINPKVDDAILRISNSARKAEQTLAILSKQLFVRTVRKRTSNEIILRIAPLKKAPVVLTTMILREALEAIKAPAQEMGQERFDDILKLIDGSLPAVDLPGKVRAENIGKDIKFSRSGED